jgi:hypothetical protein
MHSLPKRKHNMHLWLLIALTVAALSIILGFGVASHGFGLASNPVASISAPQHVTPHVTHTAVVHPVTVPLSAIHRHALHIWHVEHLDHLHVLHVKHLIHLIHLQEE